MKHSLNQVENMNGRNKVEIMLPKKSIYRIVCSDKMENDKWYY